MESSLVLLCLFLARAGAAGARASYGVGGGGEGKAAGGTVLLPLLVQEVVPPPQAPANRLRFRHNVSLTVPVAVGTPPQNVTMVLDTGSELSWLLCNGSYVPPPPFNASASSSYVAVPCSSPACQWRGRDLPVPPSCDVPPSDACRVSLSYADASSADGLLAADAFLLGGAPPVPSLFGCITSYSSTTTTNNNATDPSEAATGLLGMNRGSLSFVTQTGTRRFAYCIAPGEGPGILLLGGDGSGGAVPPLNYTPLIEISQPLPYFDRVAYSVQLEGIRVGRALLPIPKSVLTPDHTGAGQTMVDSGTQFTFLMADAYTALKGEFLNQTRPLLAPLGEPGFVFQGAFDTCFRGPEAQVTAASQLLPEVGLVLRGVEVAVAGEKLLYRVPSERCGEEAVWCLTFGNSDMVGMLAYVIGHHHQQNVWVEYDLQNGRIGFAPASCDLTTQRLGVGALATKRNSSLIDACMV